MLLIFGELNLKDQRLYKILSPALILMLASIYACNIDDVDFKDVELPNYNGDFVGPLGTASYSIPEFIETLEDDQIDIDTSQSGLLSFIYRDTTTFDDLDEILILNDVNSDGSIISPMDIPASAIIIPIDTSIVDSLEFIYPFDVDEQLDSLNFRQGSITLTYRSSFSIPLDFEIILDDVTDRATGLPLILTGTAEPGIESIQTSSLINHKVVATQNTSGENIFTGVFLVPDLQLNVGDEVSLDDLFEFNLSFSDAEFETIYGYFGNKEADIHQQVISFDFFNELEGDISFNEPEIRVTVENAFGLTLGVGFSEITATNADGQSLTLSGSVVDEPQFINGPDINSVGDAVTSVVRINSENSNIRSLFEINPTEFSLSVSGLTNYSNISTIVPIEDRNFISESSYTINILEVEIPLDVNLINFSKSFDFNIDGINLWDTDTIGIRLKSINEIPIQGTFNLQFIDSDSITIVHEINNVLAFASPEVSSSGVADAPSENVTIIPLFGNGIDAFENAPIMRVEMNVESYNAAEGQYVKLFYDSGIELIVGLEASVNLEL